MADAASVSAPGELEAALTTLFSNAERERKQQAQAYLEEFQKSYDAWTQCVRLLQEPAAKTSVEARLFAAQTLKTKITYDFHQLPAASVAELRTTLLGIMLAGRAGPRPITTQLVVALAALSLQMPDWSDPLQDMYKQCATDLDGWKCLLHFVTVLPEEVNDARRTSIPEDVLAVKETQLLARNTDNVIKLLNEFIEKFGVNQPMVFSCLNSWTAEIPIESIVKTPLLRFAFESLGNDAVFSEACEFIISIIAETREVDEAMPYIALLAKEIQMLQDNLTKVSDDAEVFAGYARIITEAADSWVVLAARLPQQFIGLVNSVAQVCKLDGELEVISYTFQFWLELRRLVTLPAYVEARNMYSSIYTDLVDIFIARLHFPADDVSGDAFRGDREAEDRFREFRHDMGDVLKDCCAVAGGERCLMLAFTKVQSELDRAAAGEAVKWQELEAPLFSMRAMAREVPVTESTILPRLMAALPRLGGHPKIRYAATLVIGRYTEWTARHPEYMEAQINYISEGFHLNDREVMSAAALALRHFCEDCRELLAGYLEQLASFYDQLTASMDAEAQRQVIEGIAFVIAEQPKEKIYLAMRQFLVSIANSIGSRLQSVDPKDKAQVRGISDDLELMIILGSVVRPYVPPEEKQHPCVQAFEEVWPIFPAVIDKCGEQQFVCERVCKCYRVIVFSYREHGIHFLPRLAEQLVAGFLKYHYGCFLWISGACVREYGSAPNADMEALWQFIESQCNLFFQLLSVSEPKMISDVVEDFFRFMLDTLLVYPIRLCTSPLCEIVLRAAMASLVIEQPESLSIVLGFVCDLLNYGFKTPPTSVHKDIPASVQASVRTLIRTHGEQLFGLVVSGVIYSFPRDCVTDASSVVRPLIELEPELALQWLAQVLRVLPTGSVSDREKEEFYQSMASAAKENHWGKLRSTFQTWTTMYRRRMVTPRSKLDGLFTDVKF